MFSERHVFRAAGEVPRTHARRSAPSRAAPAGRNPIAAGNGAYGQNLPQRVSGMMTSMREGRTNTNLLRYLIILVAAAMPAHGAVAQVAAVPETAPAAATPPSPAATEQLTVVGTSPLLGSGVDRALIPADTQVLSSASITRQGAPDVLGALNTQVSGINLDSASGNPYQPSLFYNGFEVSPLQGTSQGIAVYVNGIRFNQAFGDTVNWDLIPDVAISKLNIEGSNPVFGLNALGGSINVALKDGFSYHGGEADISGGSFGQIQADAQYGIQSGDQALYVAGSVIHEDGWRDLQSTDIQNLYTDYGIRHDGVEIHLDLTTANSVINGPGTAPIQLLDADASAQFTAPNLVANRYVQGGLRANITLNDTLSLQTQAYYSYFQQRVLNGNSPNDAPCDDGSGLLCQSPGMPSTTRGGATIADFLNGAAYSELDTQTTNTNAYGGAVQLTDTGELFGLRNHLSTGAAFDGAQTGVFCNRLHRRPLVNHARFHRSGCCHRRARQQRAGTCGDK